MKTEQEQIKEMTSDKIKKALECCAKSYGDDVHCSDCPYDTLTPRACYERFCQDVLCKDALELINEQEKSIQSAQDSILSLEQQNQEYREQQVKQAIIDVLNKLKERIKTAIDTYFNLDGGGYYLAEGAIDDIDELIKEIEEQ